MCQFKEPTSEFFLVYHGATAHSVPRLHHYRGFMITIRHTTVGRTPLDEWSARRRDLYLSTHNTHMTQTSIPPVGFEPAIPANERVGDPRLRPCGNRDYVGSVVTVCTRCFNIQSFFFLRTWCQPIYVFQNKSVAAKQHRYVQFIRSILSAGSNWTLIDTYTFQIRHCSVNKKWADNIWILHRSWFLLRKWSGKYSHMLLQGQTDSIM